MTDDDHTAELIIREQNCQAALEKLLTAYDVLEEAEKAKEIAFKNSQTAIAEAYEAGASMSELREITQLSRQRIHQIYESYRLEKLYAEERARVAAWAKISEEEYQQELERYRAALAAEKDFVDRVSR
jgi:argininosuccinate lyase